MKRNWFNTTKENFIVTHTYLIKSGNYHKIGKTTNITNRMTNYKCENPDFRLIDTVNVDIEYQLHKKYKQFNHRNEWFLLNDEQITEILNIFQASKQAMLDFEKTIEQYYKSPNYRLSLYLTKIRSITEMNKTKGEFDYSYLIRYGKYKETPFIKVLLEDPDYAEWYLTTFRPEYKANKRTLELVQYIKYLNTFLKQYKTELPNLTPMKLSLNKFETSEKILHYSEMYKNKLKEIQNSI